MGICLWSSQSEVLESNVGSLKSSASRRDEKHSGVCSLESHFSLASACCTTLLLSPSLSLTHLLPLSVTLWLQVSAHHRWQGKLPAPSISSTTRSQPQAGRQPASSARERGERRERGRKGDKVDSDLCLKYEVPGNGGLSVVHLRVAGRSFSLCSVYPSDALLRQGILAQADSRQTA